MKSIKTAGAKRRSQFFKPQRWMLGVAALSVGGLLSASPALAGNIWLTGHDADLHCAFGQQCNHFGIALDFARQSAPDKTKPILFLDPNAAGSSDLNNAAGQSAAKAKNTVEGAGNPFSFVLVNPRDASFASLALTTSAFSAIVIASDITCGGCDFNTFGGTPDSDAVNARKTDITNFFNAGGGLVYFAGAEHRDVYYNSVPVGATAAAVSPPFSLTAAGIALGLTDSDANCCPTHNSFEVPAADSALKVAEFDEAGKAETLFAGGASIDIGGGGFVPPPTDGSPVPEPASVLLMGSGLAGLVAWRIRKQA